MNISPFSRSLRCLAGITVCLPLLGTAQAQINGSWNVSGDASWATPGSWLGSPNPVPGGVGSTIYLTTTGSAIRTVNLDGSRTMSILHYAFGGTSTIQAGTGGSLTFDNGASAAQVFHGGQHTQTISAPVTLNSSLNISTANDTGSSNRVWSASITAGGADSAKVITQTAASGGVGKLDFSGVISDGAGNRKVSVHQNATGGNLQLRGANTFSGGVRVSAGTLYLAGTGLSASALGSGTLTLDGGNLVISHTVLTMAFGNNIKISADTSINLNKNGTASGLTDTFGTLSVGEHVVTVDNATSRSNTSTDNLVFGATTLGGNATFSVETAGASAMVLRLGALNGSYNLTKSGSGIMELNTAAGSYSGTTHLSGGVLRVGQTTALGSGGVSVEGASAATLQIGSGITVGNAITFSNTHADSSVNRVVAASTGFNTGSTGDFRSDLAGGIDTSVAFRASTTPSSSGTLAMRFATTSDAANDDGRVSDAFGMEFSGTTGRTFVLELSTGTTLPEGTNLGWLDDGLWKLAIDGISGGALAGEYNQSWAAFLAGHGGSFNATTMLGAYGYDLATGTGWAVINRTGEYALFAPVPEPSTWGMIGLGAGYLFLRRRRSSVRLG